MIYYFVCHASHYWIPVVVNLTILILCARYLGHLYKKDMRILAEPTIILGASMCWPLFDAGVFVFVVGWLLSKLIGMLIVKNT